MKLAREAGSLVSRARRDAVSYIESDSCDDGGEREAALELLILIARTYDPISRLRYNLDCRRWHSENKKDPNFYLGRYMIVAYGFVPVLDSRGDVVVDKKTGDVKKIDDEVVVWADNTYEFAERTGMAYKLAKDLLARSFPHDGSKERDTVTVRGRECKIYFFKMV